MTVVTWRITNVEPTGRCALSLRLVLDTDDPSVAALVERVASTFGVELEREPDEHGVVSGWVIVERE